VGEAGVVEVPTFESKSIGLSVQIAAHESDYLRIPPPTTHGGRAVVEVPVALREGLSVVGRLLGTNGLPIAGQKVRLYVVRRIPVDELDLQQERSRGEPLGVTVPQGESVAVVRTHVEVTTDEQGVYEMRSRVDGEVTIQVYRQGHPPLVAKAASIGDSNNLELRLEPSAAPARARLSQNGEGCGSGILRAVDLTRTPQTWFIVPVDPRGQFDTDWFEAGIQYEFKFVPREDSQWSGQLRFVMEWRGQSQIDAESQDRAILMRKKAGD
jgi:hypothetical protein